MRALQPPDAADRGGCAPAAQVSKWVRACKQGIATLQGAKQQKGGPPSKQPATQPAHRAAQGQPVPAQAPSPPPQPQESARDRALRAIEAIRQQVNDLEQQVCCPVFRARPSISLCRAYVPHARMPLAMAVLAHCGTS